MADDATPLMPDTQAMHALVGDLEQRVEQLRCWHAEHARRLGDQEAALRAARADVETREAHTQRLTDKLDAQRKAVEADRASLENQRRELQGRADELGEQAESLQARQTELAERQAQCEARQRKLDEDQAHHEAQRAQSEMARRQIVADRAAVDRQHSTAQSLLAELCRIEADLAAEREAIASQHEAMAAMHQAMKVQREQMERAAKQLQDRRAALGLRATKTLAKLVPADNREAVAAKAA